MSEDYQVANVNTGKTLVTRFIPKNIHCLMFAFCSIQNRRNLPDVLNLKNVSCLSSLFMPGKINSKRTTVFRFIFLFHKKR